MPQKRNSVGIYVHGSGDSSKRRSNPFSESTEPIAIKHEDPGSLSSITDPEESGSTTELGQLAISGAPIPAPVPSAAVDSEKPPSQWTAAAQVLAGHLVIFNTFGYIGSWGFFEAYYQKAFDRTFADVSWVGSIQIFLVFFIGALSGRALDAGYLRTTLAIGNLLQVIGIFATSWAQNYWQLFLSQGICVGLGNGLLFCPMISLISTYYPDKTRALAVAFAACGAATGGMVFPAIAKQLLGPLGVGWTLRIMGFVFILNAVLILALVRVRVQPRKSGPMLEWSAFREMPFLLYAVGAFLAFWGVYFAYFYISVFGTSVVHVTSDTAFVLILIINGVGIPGRLLPALIVPKAGGPINVFIPVTFFAGLLLFLWAFVHNFAGLIAFDIVYGFFANAVQSMFVGGIGSLTKDKQKMGVRIGMIFSVVSFASLTGPPIGGALIDQRNGSFLGAQIFNGSVMVAGSVALLGAAWAKKRGL